ncbi:MAG: HD domain-containing protein [Geothrix sp.]|jgi:putative nucleotidyltransferase with HDIG domain|nr:HD domain-containing protein [Holophagaceae bacterium]MBP7618136.1 HD domain-containing protein [Geothrix sp.]
MAMPTLILGEALANRCSQVLYRCLEEVGSTKGALYLRTPDQGSFEVVSFYGWPRGTRPPVSIPEGHPLLVHTQRVRRAFVVNDASDSPELAAFGQGGEWPRYLITPVYLAGDWVGLLLQRDRIKGGTFDVERDEPPTLAICGDLVEALREFRLYGTTPRPDPVALSIQVPDPPAAAAAGPAPVPEGLPTASAIIDEVAPVAERLLPPVAAPAAPVRAPGVFVATSGPPAQERMYGFAGGQDGYAALPWEADRTLSGWVAPPPPNPERKRGMVPPEQRAFFWEIAGLLSQILSASAVALWIEDPEEIRPILAYSTLALSPDLQQQLLAHATFHLPAVREQDLRLITRVEMTESPQIDGAFATYMPLLLNETLQGHDLLLVFRQEDQSFSISEIEAIQKLGRILALHMQEARLHERYHHAFISVSHRILQSSESRMPTLRPHSLATARLARDLALKLELTTEEVEAVSIGAILHDVGLLMLDPQMLAKPDLSGDELRKIRSHPELAAVFLKDLRFPFDVVKMIRHHHERWDGLGYPEGLRETSIPIGSRIIGLIEAYEVMTSGKGYRRPKGHRQVLAELENEAGAQFDPKVVEAFRELLTQKGDRG